MRVYSRIALASVILLTVAACYEQRPPPPPEVMENKSFTLDGVSYAIDLPERGKPQLGSDGVLFSGFSSRAVRFVEFKKVEAGSAEKFDRTVVLKNGNSFTYKVDYDIGGGSGGTEGELVGRIEIAGRALSVRCLDQIEGSRPEPEWCFPYLGALAIAAAPR